MCEKILKHPLRLSGIGTVVQNIFVVNDITKKIVTSNKMTSTANLSAEALDPRRSSLSKELNVSNITGDDGGVSIEWQTEAQPSDCTNEQTDTDLLESLITVETANAQSTMNEDLARNIVTDGVGDDLAVMAL